MPLPAQCPQYGCGVEETRVESQCQTEILSLRDRVCIHRGLLQRVRADNVCPSFRDTGLGKNKYLLRKQISLVLKPEERIFFSHSIPCGS